MMLNLIPYSTTFVISDASNHTCSKLSCVTLRSNHSSFAKSFNVKRFYYQAADNKSIVPYKVVGETKHYPPANKEWSNSVYTYNKNFLRTLPAKDNMANKSIQNYFHLSNCKSLARSKRMRSLIRKSTAEKLYVSKPEIKQTSDKAIVTIYTFDREKQFLLRKIYFKIRKLEKVRKRKGVPSLKLFNAYENWRNKYTIQKKFAYLSDETYFRQSNFRLTSWVKSRYILLLKMRKMRKSYLASLSIKYRNYYLKHRLNLNPFKRKRISLFKKSTKRNRIKRYIHNSGFKYMNESKFLRYIARFNKKSIQARKRVFYAYMKRILSFFNIKVLSFDRVKVKRRSNKKDERTLESIHNSKTLRYKGKVLFILKGSNKAEALSINSVQGNLPYVDKVNLLVSNFLNKILTKYDIPAEKISSFASKFSGKNFKNFLSNEYESDSSLNKNKKLNKERMDILKKETSLMNNYVNLKINRLKFSNYLPALKLLISKIYNKKAELNIVNLKYPYLNTDIYTQAIATKLRRKIGLLKVIRKSLALVKTPYGFNERNKEYNLNKIQTLNVHKSLELNNIGQTSDTTNINYSDSLGLILKRLYPRSLVNGPKTFTSKPNQINDIKQYAKEREVSEKTVSILNTIRYKWVTGVRLEAAGRLTRRYAAARSVFKSRHKGSLKNTDYSRKLDFLKESMPVVKLRNYTKANLQYTFTKSKRRIGAFGIKGWISSY